MNSTEPDHDSSHHWPVVVGRRLREIVAQRRRNRGLSRLTLGGYTITMKGAARVDLRDSYHLVIGLSWPRFILLVVAVHITVNIGFAVLYLVQPGAIANAHPGSLLDAFFFSVETSATVG